MEINNHMYNSKLNDNDRICAKPFVPNDNTEVNYNDKDWHNEALKEGNNNFRIRVIRSFFVLSAPIALLIAATFHSFSISFLIGAGLLSMFLVYFILIFRLVFIFGNQPEQNNLYRILSLSKKPDNWAANEHIGYIQLLYYSNSIQSISELSAINGAVTKVMLNTLGSYTWISIAVHYAALLTYDSNFHWDASDILMIIGCAGLLLISIFELDPFNSKMKFVHYLGALLGCGTVIGYTLQQYILYPNTWFYFSMVVTVVCFTAFIAWQIVNSASDLGQLPTELTVRGGENYNKIFMPLAKFLIPNYRSIKVNTYSRLNIGFEALFLFLGSLSLCLFLMSYENLCTFGCSESV